MKKSQILAAIALAFALGVVAPVATISNASAISFADAAVEGSKNLASGTEVANAIAAVKANADYQKAMIIIGAYNTYTATENAGEYSDYTVAANAGNLVYRGVADFGMTAPIAGVESSQAKATIAETEAVITTIKANATYKIYDNLANAVESKDATALASAIKAYNAFQTDNTKDITVANIDDDTLFDVDTAITAVNSSNVLDNYNNFNKKVEDTEKNIAQYQAGLAVLSPAFASNLLSKAGTDTYNGAYDKDTETYTLSTLLGAIYNTTYVEGNFVSTLNLNKWNTVNNKLNAITSYDTNEDTTANYNLIHGLAVDYKAATNSDKLVSAIMIELAGATIEEPTNPDELVFQTIFSADGKVSVAGNFPAGVSIQVEEVKEHAGFDSFGAQKFVAYDITLWRNGAKYDIDGQTVVVSIAVPEGINGANSDVFYVTPMGGTDNRNGKFANDAMTFTTTHFSVYAIVERAAGDAGDHTETPGNTGAVAQAEGTASATGILAGIAAALTAAGAGVVAFRNARRNAKKNA